MEFSKLLSLERKEADATLNTVIGAKTAEWGVTVSSVEIRDVAIPANPQDATSRQAQAEREKQARVASERVATILIPSGMVDAMNPRNARSRGETP